MLLMSHLLCTDEVIRWTRHLHAVSLLEFDFLELKECADLINDCLLPYLSQLYFEGERPPFQFALHSPQIYCLSAGSLHMNHGRPRRSPSSQIIIRKLLVKLALWPATSYQPGNESSDLCKCLCLTCHQFSFCFVLTVEFISSDILWVLLLHQLMACSSKNFCLLSKFHFYLAMLTSVSLTFSKTFVGDRCFFFTTVTHSFWLSAVVG